MPAIARFLYITIDAQDAERIADFWAAVLDTEREEELDEGRFLVSKVAPTSLRSVSNASPSRSRERSGSTWTSVPPT